MPRELLNRLRSHATARPDAAAIVSVVGAEPPVTFAQLAERTERVAMLLRERLTPSATVLLCYPNFSNFHVAFFGTLAAGDTIFPIPTESTATEIESALHRSGAAAAIVHPKLMTRIDPYFARREAIAADLLLLSGPSWPIRTDDGPAMLLQSSGTTDRPKIVRRDGASLDAVSRATVNACRFTSVDHVLAAVPLCHSYGVEHGLLAPMFAGSRVHLLEKFDLPIVLSELGTRGISILPGVPFMFDMLGRADDASFPLLRRAYSAGGPLPRGTFDAFLAKTGLRIGQVYGATEIGSVTFNDPDAHDFDPAGVGVAMEGVDICILPPTFSRQACLPAALPPNTEGQVAIRADSMMSGYLDSDDDAPIVEGHYLTGDLGRLDERGALTITGRLKLLIDVGGRKVNPAEVESVLRQHPRVGACVVVPMQVSETVCRLKAIVSPVSPGLELSAQDLRAFARDRLSAYKVPRVFEIRDALPTTPSGKVLRREVQAR